MSDLYIMRHQYSIDGLNDLIDYIDLHRPVSGMHMIEIGSYAGESTEIFCSRFKQVISIDPYLDNYDPGDLACQHAPFSEVLKYFQERMENFPNIGLIRATSDDAIEHDLILNKNVDFVYIDGLHTYEQVKKDIQNYLPLIKKGGFIAGHDYHNEWQGVIDAVNEHFGSPDKVFNDTSWIKRVNS